MLLWLAIVALGLLAIVIVAAILAGLFSRPIQRTPAEVARFLRDFIEGTGGDMDWDEFESVPIADPELERIRREAATAAPPGPDMAKLRDLLRQTEALAKVEGEAAVDR
jgi:hypothetical protein